MTALYLLALPLAIIIGAVASLVLSPHRTRRPGVAADDQPPLLNNTRQTRTSRASLWRHAWTNTYRRPSLQR